MMQTISTLCVALLIGGCDPQPKPDVTSTNAGVCAALLQALPVKYHRLTVDAESRNNIELGNAAYRAACNVK